MKSFYTKTCSCAVIFAVIIGAAQTFAAEDEPPSTDGERAQRTASPKANEAEYEKIKSNHADTVAGQLELAQWCREHRLYAQREAHLRRVIELDTNNADARRALGYSKVEGQWFTQTEIMTKRGYKKYKGQWKTQQEIDLAEEKRKNETAEAEWLKKVKRWRGWLENSREQQANENFAEIKDPAAVKALAAALNKKDEPAHVKKLYIEALLRIDTPDADDSLADASIYDEFDEIRQVCIDSLSTKKRPEVVKYYCRLLDDKENWVVNRAAVCLGQMKDPAAVAPLIDALITVHKEIIHKKGGDDSTSASFGGGPGMSGGGLSAGGGAKVRKNNVSNQPVLDALTTLTGQNFGFDKQAWKQWFAAKQKKAVESLDARRGE